MKSHFTQILVTMAFILSVSLQAQWSECQIPAQTAVHGICVGLPRIFIAATDSGILASQDFGRTWSARKAGLPTGSVSAVIASREQTLIAAIDSNVFLSTNGGEQWRAAPLAQIRGTIYAFAVDYELDVFAATSDGVWFSHDKGETWSRRGLEGHDCRCISVSVNGKIATGTSLNGDVGVIVSVDIGLTWVKRRNQNVNTFAVAYSPMGLYSGSYSHYPFDPCVSKSTDNGISWIDAGLMNCSISSFAFLKTPHVFAGIQQRGVWSDTITFTGVQYSSNGGSSWSAMNDGLGDRDVRCLATWGDTLFVGTSSGIYRRTATLVESSVGDDFTNYSAVDRDSVYWSRGDDAIHFQLSELHHTSNYFELSDVCGRAVARRTELTSPARPLPASLLGDGVYHVVLESNGLIRCFSLIIAR